MRTDIEKTTQPYRIAEKLRDQRRIVAIGVVALALAGGTASAAPEKKTSSEKNQVVTAYNLYSSHPNRDRVKSGHFLHGENDFTPGYDPNDPSTTNESDLWYELGENGSYKLFNTNPNNANSRCHFDELRWNPGKSGTLVYLRTKDQCGPNNSEIVFKDGGIAFVPRSWRVGQLWSKEGVSDTSYFEEDILACKGINRWQSRIVGVEKLPAGGVALHTQTKETQDLEAVPGAPASRACPPGQKVSNDYEENFYFGKKIPVIDVSGAIIGYDKGLARSVGGNTALNHPEWDTQLKAWMPKS